MTPLEAELTAALAASQRQVTELKQENELLRQKVDALVKRIFGARSEKMDPAQLELFMAGLDPAAAAPPPEDGPAAATTGDALTKSPVVPPPASRPKPARRPRLPEHLPIIEEPERSADRLSKGQPRRGERQRIKSSILTSCWPTLPGSVSSIRSSRSSSTSSAATSCAATSSGANTFPSAIPRRPPSSLRSPSSRSAALPPPPS